MRGACRLLLGRRPRDRPQSRRALRGYAGMSYEPSISLTHAKAKGPPDMHKMLARKSCVCRRRTCARHATCTISVRGIEQLVGVRATSRRCMRPSGTAPRAPSSRWHRRTARLAASAGCAAWLSHLHGCSAARTMPRYSDKFYDHGASVVHIHHKVGRGVWPTAATAAAPCCALGGGNQSPCWHWYL